MLQRNEGKCLEINKNDNSQKEEKKKEEEKKRRSRTSGDEIRDDLIEGRGISGGNLIATADEKVEI